MSRNSFASTAHSVLDNRSGLDKKSQSSRRDSLNINVGSLQPLNGSFLCLDEKKNKLVDISRVKVTSREIITGERKYSTDNKFL